MFFRVLFAASIFMVSESRHLQKFINPCGAVYKIMTPNVHGVRHVFHHLKPHLMQLIHLLKQSHHKSMDDYKYQKTWVPDESNIIFTNNALNSAKQLPEIYRSLQYFSYALDAVREDAFNTNSRDGCFFMVDTLPLVIDMHQKLVCAIGLAMGQLDVEVPQIKSVTIPEEWLSRDDCIHMFFRFSEVHYKYRSFLHAVFHLSHL